MSSIEEEILEDMFQDLIFKNKIVKGMIGDGTTISKELKSKLSSTSEELNNLIKEIESTQGGDLKMDNNKVIEIIQCGLAWANWTDEQKQAFIIASKSVEKQISFKIKNKDKETLTGTCKCGVLVNKITGEFYCKYCGQKLIW